MVEISEWFLAAVSHALHICHIWRNVSACLRARAVCECMRGGELVKVGVGVRVLGLVVGSLGWRGNPHRAPGV